METPREWARGYNRQEMNEEADGHNPGAETLDVSRPASELPTEPFPCPACGQMLAASCRVCVACRHAIDPAEIARPPVAAVLAAPARVEEAKPGPVRFPWPLFFVVLGISFFLAQIFLELWGAQKAQLAMAGVQTLAGIWVFFDALWQRIPRPVTVGGGLDAAAGYCFSLVPGAKKTAAVAVPVRRSGRATAHAFPAFCPDRFRPAERNFLFRAGPGAAVAKQGAPHF